MAGQVCRLKHLLVGQIPSIYDDITTPQPSEKIGAQMKSLAWPAAAIGIGFAGYGAFFAGIQGTGYAIFGLAVIGVARMLQSSPD